MTNAEPQGEDKPGAIPARNPPLRLFLRTLLFWMGLILSTLIFAPLSILTMPLAFTWRYRFISQWARFNLWWLKLTCKIHFVIEGKEHIPTGNAIVLCKHQSTWETFALQSIFPPQVWVLKRELLWIPFFGWGLAMLEPIAIDRKAGRKAIAQLLEQGCKRLVAGRWVVIFPEGTRIAPGQVGRYAIGGGLLAQRSGYPVVPVAHNAGEYWPRGSFLKHPGTIRVAIGPPIESRGRTAEQIIALTKAWIETKMVEIAGPRYDN